MGEWKKRGRFLRILMPLSISAVAFLAQSAGAAAQMSELDAFQRAVNTQKKQDAMAFLDSFGSSHLVPDLIELLRPDVAAEVCSSMRGGSTRARSACDKVKKAIATQPAAGAAALPQPAPTPPPAQVVAPATASPEFAVVPKSTAPLAAAPNAQTALVPPVDQEPSAGTSAARPAPPESRAEILRTLAARFDQRPFAVDYVNRERGEMVVTYAGKLANFVGCGDRAGLTVIAEPEAALGYLSNRLDSRMIIRLEGGADKTTDISVDAIHVVSIGYPGSQAQNIVDVRLDQPTQTGDGRYCWSTGEMERIAQLK